MEQYDFSPAEVLENVTIEEYCTFAIYILEYKTLILEQLAEEQEKAKLKAITDSYTLDFSIADNKGQIAEICADLNSETDYNVISNDDQPELSRSTPYGVILYTCVIRYFYI